MVAQTDCLPSGCRSVTVPATGGYNLASELTTLIYPDSRTVTTAYSTAGRMIGVNLSKFNGSALNMSYYTVPQTTSPLTWGYWPTGAMNRGDYANGLVETTGYNNRLQVGSIITAKGTATLFKKNYGYYDASGHNNGNVLAITDGLNTAYNQTYTYDALDRIATAAQQDNAFNIVFSIDAWGNMTESGTSNFNQNFDSTNRIHGWSYDASGDLLNDGSHSYTYDAEGRIKTVDGTGATYTYGPDGERVRKDTTAGSTEYIYFGSQMIAELNPATGAWTDYIFASGKRIAKDTSSNGSGAQYYQGDHLGSTRIMTDASGTVISNCIYAPYGEELGCSVSSASNHYKFTGKERDGETGLDYFGARYYSSGLGRWLSPDWSGGAVPVPYADLRNPQSLNLYEYVGNNPLYTVDYDGHGWWKNFWNGIANATYRPLVTIVKHPIITGRAIGFSVAHPIQAIKGVKTSVTVTATGVIHGNGEDIGVAVGTAAMFLIPGGEAGEAGKAAEEAAEVGKAAEIAEGSGSLADLNKSLASQEQMGQVAAGQGTPIAGAGTSRTLRDADRLAAQYGGQPGDWQKVASSNYNPGGAKGGGFEVHAYQNVKTGQVVEMKTKFQ